jgi:mRNA-degrading endonuclease RelE of RelBE toxin-antitoxin system
MQLIKTSQYRIVLTLKIVDEEIILVNIGSHDDVY